VKCPRTETAAAAAPQKSKLFCLEILKELRKVRNDRGIPPTEEVDEADNPECCKRPIQEARQNAQTGSRGPSHSEIEFRSTSKADDTHHQGSKAAPKGHLRWRSKMTLGQNLVQCLNREN
jgi:hypothetical protein